MVYPSASLLPPTYPRVSVGLSPIPLAAAQPNAAIPPIPTHITPREREGIPKG